MKRAAALLLAFLMSFAFASCTKNGEKAYTTSLFAFSSQTGTRESTFAYEEESDTASSNEEAEATEKSVSGAKASATEKSEKAKSTSKKQTEKATAKKETTKRETTEKITTKKSETKKTTTEKVKTVPAKASSTESTTREEQTTREEIKYCTVSICCTTVSENIDKLKSGKEAFVPSDGYILHEVKMSFTEGETAFDLLKRACEENVCTDNCVYCRSGGIQYEASYNPTYQSGYVEGIHQLYEKDCGSRSGWMYRVNGVFPNYGSSSYVVKNGDKIEWIYTCDLGEDIQ